MVQRRIIGYQMCKYLFLEDTILPEPDLSLTLKVYKAPAKVSLDMHSFSQDSFKMIASIHDL
jgi:hypothetical protein